MRWASIALIFLLFSTGAIAFAAGGSGPAHLDEYTIKKIIFQTINVSILLVGLIYFLRKPVADFFAERSRQFLSTAEKAASAKKEALEANNEIKARLVKMETTWSDAIQRAQAEATTMRQEILQSGQDLVARMRAEAKRTSQAEVARAIEELRTQFIQKSTEEARLELSRGLTDQVQDRLRKEFVSQVETSKV